MEVGLAFIFSGIIVIFLSFLDKSVDHLDGTALPGIFLIFVGILYLILGGKI